MPSVSASRIRTSACATSSASCSGRRSEKLDPDQLALALEDLEQAVAESDAEAEKADPQVRLSRGRERRRRRGALPAHLPRIEVVVEPETTVCPCCQEAMHVIGEDAPPLSCPCVSSRPPAASAA